MFALPAGAYLKGAVALAIMVVVLLARPEGLFGVAFEEGALMYWLRRAWAELKNEVFVLPSRTLVLVWVVALLAPAARLRRRVRAAHPHHDLPLRDLRRELGSARRATPAR